MMYYRISKNEKNLFFGKKIAQVWAVTLSTDDKMSCSRTEYNDSGEAEQQPLDLNLSTLRLSHFTPLKGHKQIFLYRNLHSMGESFQE